MIRLGKKKLITTFRQVRKQTELLCQPLFSEDYCIQAMEDVSPPKWHLAHTTWFFETFLLLAQIDKYQPFNLSFQHLFNSYYLKLGNPYPRSQRGLLSRPAVKVIYDYRSHVNHVIIDYIEQSSDEQFSLLYPMLELGLQHEQQHQELLLMDIKYNFSIQPNFPVYYKTALPSDEVVPKINFIPVEGGIVKVGYGDSGFCFDNELPQHFYYLKPYSIADRLVTNGEYLEFMEAGGYSKPLYWLADGWGFINKENCQSPHYWKKQGSDWYVFTLSGLKKINLSEPASHVSYYEADAYARWQNKRLPLEAEWEHFVASKMLSPQRGNFSETKFFHPIKAYKESENYQFFGDLWEWTRSPYGPYPGYRPKQGNIEEYNGKFMTNQMVLRGGSCVTPGKHIRASYRNFFHPEKRWQFSGIRLAADGDG
jgi:ergothioneine biosynthesis protein EgtB